MKFTTSLLFLLFLQANMFGQKLTGAVLNQKNKTITNAQIINISSKNHTHSDEKGVFSLENNKIGDTLKITHLGYISKTMVVNGSQKNLLVHLNEKSFSIDEIVIAPKLNALTVISEIDLQTNPVNSSQDILRQVPGLFIGQHAGGGKAEQLFLRGFDVDHGTDVAIEVDGMPVNMVSHAHGQGYADLHFVIPETIEKIDFEKGSYSANKGNFNTAGAVSFQTKKTLDNSLLKIEMGDFNQQRILGMFQVQNNAKKQSYFATESLSSDGAFESPQNFKRINLFGKYSENISEESQFGIVISHFNSKWDASGQIPQRAVDNGSISRFGAIDNTEGGKTSRSNLIVNYDQLLENNASLKNKLYFSNYDFELFSNFTFFLEDPINGDQIKQKERRNLVGWNSEYSSRFSTKNSDIDWQLGLGFRNDQSSDTELSHTFQKTTTLEQLQLGNINETNLNLYLNTLLKYDKWSINIGLRADYFEFQYQNQLIQNSTTFSNTKTIFSPKFNLLYNANDNLQLYLKSGKGFHSNDTRVVTAAQTQHIIPASYSADLGFLWKASPKTLINIAYWNLFLEQEFVYVGDAGIVEPSGETNRKGVDVSIRYQALKWLFWNFDTNYTYARALNTPEGENYIPLAPDFTLVSGLTAKFSKGFYGGIHNRFLKSRPANEQNSIRAKGYHVVDANLGYRLKKMDFGIQIQNLLNTEWNETQFATESRLNNETNSVEEIHFTPGTPFFIKASIAYNF